MKNNLNLHNMTRDELAHYIVAHRNTPQGIEARRIFIRRMAEKAKSHGIKFDRSQIQAKPFNDLK